jgi:uncharacterized protein YndB with AHSA1/START domain
MPLKKDADGNRSVEAEIEVPGTPEDVWNAIATGPGISSWFVPTQVEEREGGTVNACFGPGMDSVSKITEWQPPHHYVAESRDDMGPDDPTVATEWIVEAKSGGTCIVRVVHRWFTSRDDWDAQFEGHEHGWREFFQILRLYVRDFPGQTGHCVQLVASSAASKTDAWSAFTGPLGLAGAQPEQRVSSPAGRPSLAGRVERVGPPEHAELLLLRLDQPAPGIASVFAMPMGGRVLILMRMYLFGAEGEAAAARVEPEWQSWINRTFPAASP